jgi:hypothetical protein
MKQIIKNIGIGFRICQTIYLVPTSPFSISHHCRSIQNTRTRPNPGNPPASLSNPKDDLDGHIPPATMPTVACILHSYASKPKTKTAHMKGIFVSSKDPEQSAIKRREVKKQNHR